MASGTHSRYRDEQARRCGRPEARSLPRPLDPVRSFKVKIGLLVSAPVIAAGFTFWIEAHGVAGPLAVALVSPGCVDRFPWYHAVLGTRDDVAAQRDDRGRTGDGKGRLLQTRAGDVARRGGRLAIAFNQMSTDLAAADRYRRELIANVSHEIRTPIAALQAVLENVVDGVGAADTATLRSALNQTQRLGQLVSELLDLPRLDGGWLSSSAVKSTSMHS